MTDLYKPPESNLSKPQKRTFRTPLIVPLTVLMVVCIYAGYAYYHFTAEEKGLFQLFASISFEVFVGTQIGMIFIALFTKQQLDKFLELYPSISDQASLDKFKPVARTNMYLSLVNLFLLGLGALTAIMSILNYGGLVSIIIVILALATGRVTKWCTESEERIKQIECADSKLEKELNEIFYCWQNKPFPNF